MKINITTIAMMMAFTEILETIWTRKTTGCDVTQQNNDCGQRKIGRTPLQETEHWAERVAVSTHLLDIARNRGSPQQ